MSGIRTEYEFVLPRGYVDESGGLHRKGTMRLATARDELQPLRDPTVTSPDDPRLTILVLARVTVSLGTLDQVNPHVIEGLFAADLAYLQDFYGIINFGTDDEIEAMLALQRDRESPTPKPASDESRAETLATDAGGADSPEDRAARRRAAIEEVPSAGR